MVSFFVEVSFARDYNVEPVSEDLLLVDGNNLYVENVSVREVSKNRIEGDAQGQRLLNIKIDGLQEWGTHKLNALYQCNRGRLRWLRPTINPEIWGIQPETCKKRKFLRLCLTDSETRVVCSAWLRHKDFKPRKVRRKISSTTKAPFKVKDGKDLKWSRSDGSYIKIFNMAEVIKKEKPRKPPVLFSSMLLSGVQSTEDTLFLGTGQISYWPKAAEHGNHFFDPQRIGAQLRISRPINTVTLSDLRELSLNWFDFSINYRKRPNGIFDDNHLYAFVTYSNYSLLSRTTVRAGGGLGYSIAWDKSFWGLTWPGEIFSYVDFSFLPIDLSGDGRGIIVSSRANGVWLFPNNFFLTGDIEMRLLNFTLQTENSVVRVQFGGGLSF